MANLPISGMPAAGPLAGTELMEVVQDGVNKRVPINTVLGLVPPSGLAAVVDDPNPVLGGNLDADGNAITGASNIQTNGMDFDQITASGANASGINMATTRIVNLGDPVNPQDAATKFYIDDQKAAANGLASLGGDGKVPTSQLPAIAFTDVFVVASEVAQLALVAEEGDVAVRTDLNTSFIHNGGTAGDMTDWQELLTPGAVLSVNGYTGAITLDTDDVAEGATNLYYTQARFDTAFGAKNTDDLAEGATNLFYTEGRFDTSFAGKSATDLAFTQTNPGDWTTDPQTTAEALDELAAREAGTGDVSSTDIFTIDVVTQVEYNALSPPDADTLYIIVG